jgi:hypothetical protein
LIYGEAGNDTLVYDSEDTVIDGGVGMDTLLLTSNTTIDFSSLDGSTNPIKNMEVIDLSKATVELKTLSLSDVVDITGAGNTTHILTILGDSADKVTVDSTLSKTSTSTEVVNGATHTFDVYTHTNASDPTVIVKIEQVIQDN